MELGLGLGLGCQYVPVVSGARVRVRVRMLVCARSTMKINLELGRKDASMCSG